MINMDIEQGQFKYIIMKTLNYYLSKITLTTNTRNNIFFVLSVVILTVSFILTLIYL